MKMMCGIYVHHSQGSCMHTKNPRHMMLVCVQVYSPSTSLILHDFSILVFPHFLKLYVLQNKKTNAENHISCPTNTYILYKYIHKYILHTTAINLKRGYIEQRDRGGSVCVLAWCCKMVCPSMICSVRWAGVVLCVDGLSMHTHVNLNLAISVGPVGRAAIAGLVDLALLLHAVGLATLARATLSILS